MPNLYIIGGCNGAGKTTASYTILPEMLQCREFVNADEIARGLSPFQPESVALAAGRLMLQRIRTLIGKGEDFAFETTLSGKSHGNLIRLANTKGYVITLLYFWIKSPEMAIERVRNRAALGGHDIPGDVVRRRYYAGLHNLFEIYIPLCDYWILADNSDQSLSLIAEGFNSEPLVIHDHHLYKKLRDAE